MKFTQGARFSEGKSPPYKLRRRVRSETDFNARRCADIVAFRLAGLLSLLQIAFGKYSWATFIVFSQWCAYTHRFCNKLTRTRRLSSGMGIKGLGFQCKDRETLLFIFSYSIIRLTFLSDGGLIRIRGLFGGGQTTIRLQADFDTSLAKPALHF